jgi:hypothetical protein
VRTLNGGQTFQSDEGNVSFHILFSDSVPSEMIEEDFLRELKLSADGAPARPDEHLTTEGRSIWRVQANRASCQPPPNIKPSKLESSPTLRSSVGPLCPRQEAKQRRGFDPAVTAADRAKNRSLFFDELLDANVREFNPRLQARVVTLDDWIF